MFITIEELKTHLYEENVGIITRDDDTIIIASIDGAIQEAKGYLSAYDKERIFNAKGNKRNALLVIFVKDIAVWHFINICNAGTDIELRKHRYDRAVDWLKAVQKGDVTPDFEKKQEENKQTGTIIYGSNTKKNQHF